MPASINRREAVLSLLSADGPRDYTPAAFFTHFPPDCHFGPTAVEKHLRFFRETGMDFVKIQYERAFPRLDSIRRPEDWASTPLYGLDFYEPQLAVVKGLVEAAKAEALVLATLYSPFMCAGHAAGQEALNAHLSEDPAAVRKGLEVITESLMLFVRECIRLGVDGFYHSTQGGEHGRFADPSLFVENVKPFDLVLMGEIERRCVFNILHVCDYHGGYDDLGPFLDYPGHVVNCSLHVGGKTLTAAEVSRLFDRPFMGGMERKGVLATGTPTEAAAAARAALRDAPERFILGADCTVPCAEPWPTLKAAIAAAHERSQV